MTEPVTETVQVEREQARVEREPVTDADATADIGEAEQEVTLTEEQPVVDKRAVPKERVRIGKEPVTEERQVSEEVRKEQIEAEGDVEQR